MTAFDATEFSSEIDKLAPALVAFQGAMSSVQHDDVNDYHGNRYATLAACLDHVRADLLANGLTLVQCIGGGDDRVTCTGVLLHTSGQWMRSTASTRVSSSKNPAQATGIAVSYLRRYQLCAMLSLSTADSDAEPDVSVWDFVDRLDDLGWGSNALRRLLTWMKKPGPRSMDAADRAKVLRWLASPDSTARVDAWRQQD